MNLCQDETVLFPGEQSSEKGGVLALVALFLPVAVIVVGMVIDLGLIYTARKAVQAACDLGALAGAQVLDLDELALGNVLISDVRAQFVSLTTAYANMASLEHWLKDVCFEVTVYNIPDKDEPSVMIDAFFKVNARFLSFLPVFSDGVPFRLFAVASVVERTQW